MAIRRHLALPKIALAAALGATALATTATAAEDAFTHSDGTHNATAFPSGYGDVKDWNTMVPDGETADS